MESQAKDASSDKMDVTLADLQDSPPTAPSASSDPPSVPLSPENISPSPITSDLANELARSLGTPASSATPNIPQATPIPVARSTLCSSNSHGTNSFYSLLNRHAVVDCYTTLPALRRTMYSLPSMVQRLSLESRLKEHQGCVNCINFSWGGDLLASGSDDLHVVLWNWAREQVVNKFDSGHVANVFQAKFMPHSEDRVLVTAARDGQVLCHVLTSTGNLHHSKRVGHHNDSAHKLSIEPNSSHVFLSCGEDGSVLQIDLRDADNERNRILVCKNEKNHRVSLYSIFIDPSDPNYFAISGRDQWARIYDRRLLRQEGENRYTHVKKYCPHHLMTPENEMKRANVTCLVYSHDGRELLCSYNDEDVYLFDTSHSTEADYIHKYCGHRNSATVKGVNFFGLESEYVVSGSDCGNVFLWDKHTEKVVQYMEGDFEGVVNCLEPHPHIPVLATSGLDHDVKIFSPCGQPTKLEGLSEVMEQNQSNRREAWDANPTDGYEVIMEFIMRQYRRGLRERVGIQEEEDTDDDSFADTPPNERGDDDAEGRDETDEEGRQRVRRCIQQ